MLCQEFVYFDIVIVFISLRRLLFTLLSLFLEDLLVLLHINLSGFEARLNAKKD